MKMKKMKMALVFTALIGAASGLFADPACDPTDSTVVCGLVNAEDLVRLGPTPWVVASHINFKFPKGKQEVSAGLGPLEAVRIDTRKVQRLYPTATSEAAWERELFPDCPAPPENISSAGVNARPLGANRFRLYVANHGDRHSVEVIDLTVERDGLLATWRGCILAPDYIWANSVVPLPDNGVALSGKKVAVWRPGQGWAQVESYTGNLANGIEVSKDAQWLYVASGNSVVKAPIQPGIPASTLPLEHFADNLRWGEDGSLYATFTNPRPGEDLHKCLADVVCQLPFTITRIDVGNWSTQIVFRSGESGAKEKLGLATVALQIGDHAWIGGFRADRVAIVPLSK